MKLAIILPALLPLLLAAQQSDLFEKAPPHIDKALRERVSFFYQAHVDGKFRQADTVVHEDSKDAFFVADKNRYRGFEIIKINYAENFTKAVVVVAVDTDFFLPGFGKTPVTIPLTTTWKYDAGEWWWYVTPPGEEGVKTPFGMMKPGKEGTNRVMDKLKNMPSRESIGAKVRISKSDVKLSSVNPAEDEVEVFNGMQGPVSLRVEAAGFEGFEATLDDSELKSGGKTKIHIRCHPQNRLPKPTVTVKLFVQPINYVIPIRVEFNLPPEIEKRIPKSVSPVR